LGESQSQRSRLRQTCFHPPHAAKALQSLIKSSDGLLKMETCGHPGADYDDEARVAMCYETRSTWPSSIAPRAAAGGCAGARREKAEIEVRSTSAADVQCPKAPRKNALVQQYERFAARMLLPSALKRIRRNRYALAARWRVHWQTTRTLTRR
jgi:hypothetical protein